MMNDEIQRPEWLVDGVAILVYSFAGLATGRAYDGVRQTTVKKVSTTSFSIHDAPGARLPEPRIQIRGLQSANFQRYVIPLDSDKARQILTRDARDDAVHYAESAVRLWQRNRSRKSRLAAIKALQELENHEGADQS